MKANQYTVETGGNPDYYDEYTLTNLYVEKVFGGFLSTINITNDSTTETVSFSYDGATLAGEVKPGESVTVNVDQRHSIYIKGSVGADNVRIWGWATPMGTTALAAGGAGLVTEKYDYIGLAYTGVDLTTVLYKLGGSGGSTVATLTLAYTSNILDSITRT